MINPLGAICAENEALSRRQGKRGHSIPFGNGSPAFGLRYLRQSAGWRLTGTRVFGSFCLVRVRITGPVLVAWQCVAQADRHRTPMYATSLEQPPPFPLAPSLFAAPLLSRLPARRILNVQGVTMSVNSIASNEILLGSTSRSWALRRPIGRVTKLPLRAHESGRPVHPLQYVALDEGVTAHIRLTSDGRPVRPRYLLRHADGGTRREMKRRPGPADAMQRHLCRRPPEGVRTA